MANLRTRDELARRVKFITLSIAGWSGVAALFLLQRIFGSAIKGRSPAWDQIALELSINWGAWAALTPLIYLIVRRLPLPVRHPQRIMLHVPIGICIGLLHSLIFAAITPLFIWRPSFLPIRDMFTGRLASAIAGETLIYFMVAAVFYAWIYTTEARPRLVSAPDRLAVPERDGLLSVPVEAIDWLQAEDNYVRVYSGGRSHLMRTTLSSLEEKLASRDFLRIHRSAIVSLSRIARIKRIGPGRHVVILTTGAQLPVSRAYRQRVIESIATPLAPQ